MSRLSVSHITMTALFSSQVVYKSVFHLSFVAPLSLTIACFGNKK